jgi:outer membrane protein OmpA-like peptidoglycan-associated protein
VEIAAPGVGVLSTVPYIDETFVTVSGVNYAGSHIDYAARGTASGALVDGGLCTSTGAWAGKVVLCQRGTNTFYEKVMNVQNSGGAAAVIYNNVPGGFLGTLGDGYSSTIVAVSLSMEDGQYLVANRLGQTATVSSMLYTNVSGYEYYDGTSMATPHASAVAALVWSADPTATNAEVRAALTSTALATGALIGAGVGALAGGSVGLYLDKQQKELEKIAETKRTENGLLVEMKGDILFDSGSSALKPEAIGKLEQMGDILAKYGDDRIRVEGYTDSTGSKAMNEELSLRRADAVKRVLVGRGVQEKQITALGMGPVRPVADNGTASGRAQNRRVELHIDVPNAT